MGFIFIKRKDGGVSVMCVVDGVAPEKAVADWESVMGKAEKWQVGEDSDKPVSRNWRNAWYLSNGKIDIDLEEAKKAHRELIWSQAYAKADRDFQWPHERTAFLQEVATQSGALGIDSTQTLTELYNKWPAIMETRATPRDYVVHKE